MTKPPFAPATILAHRGRPATGPVNQPVSRGSTIRFQNLADLDAAKKNHDLRTHYTYGRTGNPNAHDFEQVMCDLEGGHGAVTASSGLGIIATTLLAFLKTGDHLLIVDTVYGPVRRFCEQRLRPNGIDVEYYDPLLGAGITKKFRATTKMVYLESPGSKTFEVQDVPAIAAAARARGIVSAIDNTWATPLFFRPLGHGANISLHAATKYLAGHSDLFLGVAICADAATYTALKNCAIHCGQCASPDDLVLALRGLRTLAPRLAQHQAHTAHVLSWLQTRPEVKQLLYPALPDNPHYPLWQRDFTGATGLFTMLLQAPSSPDALRHFVDGLQYFPLGYSWGGFESLILPLDLAGERTATSFAADGLGLRLHIGLEDPGDLIADLTAGFDRMAAA